MVVLTRAKYKYEIDEQSKSNLESDHLVVQVIYEYHRAKGISYIVMGRRVLGIGYLPKEIDMYRTYEMGVIIE